MDLKAIEAALEKCERTRDPRTGVLSDFYTLDLVEKHGPDILRIVRAMGWMEEKSPQIYPTIGGVWICNNEWGRTPVDAIEIARAVEEGHGEQRKAQRKADENKKLAEVKGVPRSTESQAEIPRQET